MEDVIVMDNSINSRMLWPDTTTLENNHYAIKVIEQAEKNVIFHVPTIWLYEKSQVAASLLKSGKATRAETQHYLDNLEKLPIVIDSESHGRASSFTFALSLQYKLSIYDAAYMELAMRLHAPLASNDQRLNRAAEKAGLRIWDA